MIKIGDEIHIENMEKLTIEGNKAPKVDCVYFKLSFCNHCIVTAVKCREIRIYKCEDITIAGCLVDNVRVEKSDKVILASNVINKQLIMDKESKVDTLMNIIKERKVIE